MDRKTTRRVTIQSIAKELNLSRNTVSKALKDSQDVSEETKHLVIRKAMDMGYSKLSPVLLRRYDIGVKSTGDKSIVVLARKEDSIFWSSIIMGISDGVNQLGSTLQVNFVSQHDEKNLILPLNFHNKVEGIIFLNVFSKKYIDEIVRCNGDTPAVFLDAPSDVQTIGHYGDIIVLEGFSSIQKITQHLIKQGIKKIGFIGDITYCKTMHDRYQGYLAAMKSSGLEVDDSIVAVYHPPNRFYEFGEVEAALKRFPYLPEALVCANDDIALNAIKYLKLQKISIPQDIAVTGYDDLESTMHVVEPFVTTVGFSKQGLGKRLVQQLMWRMDNKDFPNEVVYIGGNVIFRRSSFKHL